MNRYSASGNGKSATADEEGEARSIPAIYVSSGTSSIIAGSEKTIFCIESYIEENVLHATCKSRLYRSGQF